MSHRDIEETEVSALNLPGDVLLQLGRVWWIELHFKIKRPRATYKHKNI